MRTNAKCMRPTVRMGSGAGQAAERACVVQAPARRLCLSALVAAAAVAAVPATGRAAEAGGSAVGWGRNGSGQLGAGFTTQRGLGGEASPVTVAGLSNIVEITTGDDWTLARLSDGTVRAWGGTNSVGELGDGEREGVVEETVEGAEPEVIAGEEQRSTVGGLSHVKSIAAAAAHGLALLENGDVVAWGNAQNGELGNGVAGTEIRRKNIAKEKNEPFESQLTPKVVKSLVGRDVVAIAAGGGSDFALIDEGAATKVMAWGRNTHGQLGIGEEEKLRRGPPEICLGEVGEVPCSTIPREVELKLPAGVKVTAVSAGSAAAFALLSNGHVMAWGNNGKGHLGTGAKFVDFFSPQPVANLSNAVAVSSGDEDTLALLASGEVVGWGGSGNGELGTSSATAEKEACRGEPCHVTPQPINGLKNIAAVSAGADFSLALTNMGKVYAFGRNKFGRLGTGSLAEKSDVPTPIEGIGPVAAISAGEKHSMALLQSGVAPPVPLLSLHSGADSLLLQSRVGDRSWEPKEVKVHYHPLGDGDQRSKEFGLLGHEGSLGSLLFSGLTPEPYVVTLITGELEGMERGIAGTPEA